MLILRRGARNSEESTGSGSHDACPTPGDSASKSYCPMDSSSPILGAPGLPSSHRAPGGPWSLRYRSRHFQAGRDERKKLAETPMTVSKGSGHCPHELPSHTAVL